LKQYLKTTAPLPGTHFLTFIFFIQPLKMDLTEGSETSARINQTPGKYPKENMLVSEQGENLKSRIS
jgi:hypothetical protein